MTRGGRRPLLAATCAAALGLVLLSSTQGSWARWWTETEASVGSVSSGSVELSATGPAVMLLSQQPAGTRTFAAAETCTIPAGYQECRVVTDTLGQERLVPGDRLRLQHQAVLEAAGANLAGSVTVDASSVVLPGSSDLSAAAMVTTTVQPPGADPVVLPDEVGEFPVHVGSDTGVGTYHITVDIDLPATDQDSQRWNDRLWSQPLDLNLVRVSFTQG